MGVRMVYELVPLVNQHWKIASLVESAQVCVRRVQSFREGLNSGQSKAKQTKGKSRQNLTSVDADLVSEILAYSTQSAMQTLQASRGLTPAFNDFFLVSAATADFSAIARRSMVPPHPCPLFRNSARVSTIQVTPSEARTGWVRACCASG